MRGNLCLILFNQERVGRSDFCRNQMTKAAKRNIEDNPNMLISKNWNSTFVISKSEFKRSTAEGGGGSGGVGRWHKAKQDQKKK
jgi:hypothetical protein